MERMTVFLILLLVALGLLTVQMLAAVHRYLFGRFDRIGGVNLSVAMEFTLGAVILSVLPFLLVAVLGEDTPSAWGAGSFVLGLFLLLQIVRIYAKMNALGARWPLVMATLLVLTGGMLALEWVNAFRWSSLAWYVYGLVWILVVAALQWIAFAAYDAPHDDHTPGASPDAGSPAPPADPGYHGLLPERLRRERRAAHPDRPANHYANPHRDPIAAAKRERYAHRYPFTRTHTRAGRAVPDSAVRPDADRRSR